MTEPRTLSDAFDRASDGIEPPGLAAVALAGAQRRRGRRRGVGAALVSSVAVVAVVVATQVGGGRVDVAPPVGPGTPTPTVSAAPQEKVWPEWDPRRVDDLPAAPEAVAPALPDVIDPPATSPTLADSPVTAAVLDVETDDRTLQLLGTDGAWRSVRLSTAYPVSALSPGGTRLVVWDLSARDPVTVYDLAGGTSRPMAYPPGYSPRDDSSWRWLDEDTLLLGPGQGWLVEATDGTARRVPFGGDGRIAVDPDGQVLEEEGYDAPTVLVDWASGARREVSTGVIGRLESLAAGRATVTGSSYTWTDRRPFSVVVADRGTLRPLASLPIDGALQQALGDGAVGVAALTDDGTVLLSVAKPGRDGSRIVAWDPVTGDLSLVSSNPVARAVGFADGLLRAGEPVATSSIEPAPTPVIDVEPQPRWDPATVTDLPWRNLQLDRELMPHGDSGHAALRTLAVLGREDALWLLDDGSLTQRLDRPAADTFDATAISADGSRVAAVGDGGLWWRPTAGGDWTRLELPSGHKIPFDPSSVHLDFVDPDRLLLQQGTHSWVVDTGGSTILPFDQLDVVVPAADGVLALRFADTAHRSVDLWSDGEVSTLLDPSLLGATQSLASDGRSMVTTVTTGAAGSSALLALDLTTARVRAYLPVRDPDNRYTDGGQLRPVGWLDDDTVLVEVTRVGDPVTTWLVTWDVRSGDLARVASYPSDQKVAYAVDALPDA